MVEVVSCPGVDLVEEDVSWSWLPLPCTRSVLVVVVPFPAFLLLMNKPRLGVGWMVVVSWLKVVVVIEV